MFLNSTFPYAVWQRRAAVVKPALGDTEETMARCSSLFTLMAVLLHVGIVKAQESQYPIMDKIAQRVVQKYQTSSCQQLA